MPPRARHLLSRFRGNLPQGERAVLDAALGAASTAGVHLFLVGGTVRDLLLGRQSLDIDIAVEGDIDAFASELGAVTSYRLIRHGRFGTGTLRGEGFTIDFARTRRETYARPGALPIVEAAGIEQDLARRDFTVNAIALRLTPPREGELLDPSGGREDLSARSIRVLHDRSFQDDATRMLRACRYAARLGFQIATETLSLLRRDLAYVDTISGPRLRRELSLMFREGAAVEAAVIAWDLGIFAAIHPLLRLSPDIAQRWRQALAGERYASVEELGYCLVSGCRSEADVLSLSSRLHLTGRLQAALLDLVRLDGASAKLEQPDLDVTDAVQLLQTFAPAAVWAFALKRDALARERALKFLRDWRRVRVSLNGFDLQEMGFPPGPLIGDALRRLKAARLRGEVRGRDAEVALIRREFPSARAGP